MSGVQKQMINGVMWNAAQKYASTIITLIVTMVMARMLSPKDFGVIAIALVVIAFFNNFSSMGIGPAIIQRKDLSQDDFDNIYSFSVYLGIVLSIILFVASWPIADYYESDILKPICQILCIDVFYAAINLVPMALMSKHKRFKEMALRTILISIASGVLSLIAVFLGMGIYSLLINPVITAIGIYLFNIHYYPLKFHLIFSFEPLRRIASYSAYQFAFQFVGFFSLYLDKLIIGKFISPVSLGHYDRAHSLTKYPMSMLTSVVTPILHPFLSDFQTDVNRIKEGNNMVVRHLSSLSFPMSVMLWFCGPELIQIFFGGQWDSAIYPFQILTLSIPPTLILATSGAFWQSTNSTKLLFWTGLTNSSIIIVGYVLASIIFGTISAVAWSYVFTSILIFFITYYIMYKRVFKSPLVQMLKIILNPCFNAIFLTIVYISFELIIQSQSIICSLVFKLLIGCIFTLFFMQLTRRYNIIRMIKEKKLLL